jgi:hypothetical protein
MQGNARTHNQLCLRFAKLLLAPNPCHNVDGCRFLSDLARHRPPLAPFLPSVLPLVLSLLFKIKAQLPTHSHKLPGDASTCIMYLYVTVHNTLTQK